MDHECFYSWAVKSKGCNKGSGNRIECISMLPAYSIVTKAFLPPRHSQSQDASPPESKKKKEIKGG